MTQKCKSCAQLHKLKEVIDTFIHNTGMRKWIGTVDTVAAHVPNQPAHHLGTYTFKHLLEAVDSLHNVECTQCGGADSEEQFANNTPGYFYCPDCKHAITPISDRYDGVCEQCFDNREDN